ncbi:MAG: DUF4105 domain-containing protein, partial [Gemmatimonadales bacterium]|nr:DUF4105 domain-containing protein [Gemmatimonadales bacterium]
MTADPHPPLRDDVRLLGAMQGKPLRRRLSPLRALLPILFLAPGAAAQVRPAAPDTGRGTELTVSLVTMGPGKAVWERFGHNALWVRDNRTSAGRIYNYGLFSFEQEHFIVRFVQGRPEYWMQGFDAEPHFRYYVEENRSVWVQELNLTPAQRADLRDFLEWNERPENRFYRYDPYRDNCSTRIRDAIDRVLGGRLQDATGHDRTYGTYRSHSLRLVADHLPTYVGLMLALGEPADRLLSAWEAMFIPLEMRRYVRDVMVPGADGREEPLVLSERTLFESTASYGRDTPPDWLLAFLAAGLAIAGLIALPMLRPARNAARVAATLTASLWTLATGAAGMVLAGLWLFTDHRITYGNVNLF